MQLRCVGYRWYRLGLGSREGYRLGRGILYCLTGVGIAGQAEQRFGSPGECCLFVPWRALRRQL